MRTGPCGRSSPRCAGARSSRWSRRAAWAAPRTWPICWLRGADLVQAGTAFLRCPESGAPAALKDALATSAAFGATEVTRAFSGRRARALVNAMVREHRGAPAAYPEINNATRPLRAAAARAGDPEHMSLYAGTAFAQAEARPAAEVVERLVSGVQPVSSGRQKKTIEFTPPDVAAVAHELDALRAAGGGWVNLMPGIDEEASDVHPRAGLFAFFGNNAAPVTMTTVMPPKKDRSDSDGLTVGIMHPTGSKAVERLAEAGVTVPEGWVVRQDHARRGLLLRTPVAVTEPDVIDWSVRGRHRVVPGGDDGPVAGRGLPSVGGYRGDARRRSRRGRAGDAGSRPTRTWCARWRGGGAGGGGVAAGPAGAFRLVGVSQAQGGQANETLLVDLGPSHPGMVVRLPPLEATFPDYDLGPQALVQNAVAAAGVPAPAPALS